MLLGTFGACLLENMLASKGFTGTSEGKKSSKRQGTIRSGKDFYCSLIF